MFGSLKDNNQQNEPVVSQAPPRPSSRTSSSVEATSTAPTAAQVSGNFLSKGVSINGNLKLSGDITIDGDFNGEITSKGIVTLNENATVKAKVDASTIVIYGKIEGNIVASDRVEVLRTANVQGDVKAGVLKVDPGAIIAGNVQIGSQSSAKSSQSETAKSSTSDASSTGA